MTVYNMYENELLQERGDAESLRGFSASPYRSHKPEIAHAIFLSSYSHGEDLLSTYEEKILSVFRDDFVPEVERVYFGSYFCEHKFLALTDEQLTAIDNLCYNHDLPATLVLPIFGQSTLERGKQHIDRLLNKYPGLFREVVVNDLGMLAYFADMPEMRVHLGRLFARSHRDPRYSGFDDGAREPSMGLAELESYDRLRTVSGFELDPFHGMIDLHRFSDTPWIVSMHAPYCYLTTGRICETASRDRRVDSKFKAGAPCSQECLDSYILNAIDNLDYHRGSRRQHGDSIYTIKDGRTVFVEVPPAHVRGIGYYRVIHTPRFAQKGVING